MHSYRASQSIQNIERPYCNTLEIKRRDFAKREKALTTKLHNLQCSIDAHQHITFDEKKQLKTLIDTIQKLNITIA